VNFWSLKTFSYHAPWLNPATFFFSVGSLEGNNADWPPERNFADFKGFHPHSLETPTAVMRSRIVKLCVLDKVSISNTCCELHHYAIHIQTIYIYIYIYIFDVWLTVHRSSMWNKKPTRCHLVLYLFLLISCSLYLAQHVSGHLVPVFRSWRLSGNFSRVV